MLVIWRISRGDQKGNTRKLTDDLRQRIANLSPKKHALFEHLLMLQTAAGAKPQAISPRDPSTLSPPSSWKLSCTDSSPVRHDGLATGRTT
jgi:hypothetical protein